MYKRHVDLATRVVNDIRKDALRRVGSNMVISNRIRRTFDQANISLRRGKWAR